MLLASVTNSIKFNQMENEQFNLNLRKERRILKKEILNYSSVYTSV